MKPYYKDDWVTIYHGDCRDVLPNLGKFDLLLTDPPYGINGGSGTVGKSRAHKHAYTSFEDTIENIEKIVVPGFRMAIAKCDRAILTPGPKALHLYPPCDAFGSFYQPATAALCLWGRANSQPIFYYGRPHNIGKTINDTTFVITNTISEGASDHPCPKPLIVWKKMVVIGSAEGHEVLDPFAGAGTTGRACKDLGRKCTMIEIDEAYCEIAARRMGQEVFDFSTP